MSAFESEAMKEEAGAIRPLTPDPAGRSLREALPLAAAGSPMKRGAFNAPRAPRKGRGERVEC